MKMVNYNNIKNTTEIGIKFPDDESVFKFFDRSGLNFGYVKQISFGKERRHPIQKVPDLISVLDTYEYHHNKWKWVYKNVMNIGRRLPVVCNILRECQYKEYELIVEFFPLISEFYGQSQKYNLLRPIGELYEYSGIVVTFKNPNKEMGQHIPMHKSYILQLICSIVSYNLEHYAVELGDK
jgi:hypothetical protein